MSDIFETGPAAPFIASKYVPRDRAVRVLATGRTRGHSPLIQTQARFGDIEATGRRPETSNAAAAARGEHRDA